MTFSTYCYLFTHVNLSVNVLLLLYLTSFPNVYLWHWNNNNDWMNIIYIFYFNFLGIHLQLFFQIFLLLAFVICCLDHIVWYQEFQPSQPGNQIKRQTKTFFKTQWNSKKRLTTFHDNRWHQNFFLKQNYGRKWTL